MDRSTKYMDMPDLGEDFGVEEDDEEPMLEKNESGGKIKEDSKTKSNRVWYMIKRLEEAVIEYNQEVYNDNVEAYLSSWFDFFQHYHSMHYQFEEFWKFAGLTKKGKLNPIFLEKLVSETVDQDEKKVNVVSEVWERKLEYYFTHPINSFYGELYCRWNIRIHPNVFEKINAYEQDIKEDFIYYLVNEIIWGNFEMEDQSYTMFGHSTFYIPMGENYVLFASTNIERIPIVESDGSSFSGQRYVHVLKLLNLHSRKDMNTNTGAKDRISAACLIQDDPNKYKLFEEPYVRKIFKVGAYAIVCRAFKQEWVAYGQAEGSEVQHGEEMSHIYCPMQIKTKGELISSSYNLFKFDGKTWVCESELEYYTAGVEMAKEVEQAINSQTNREMMLEFFERLEKIGIKFEKNQKHMLLSTNNTIALGRSGTGKTTVSAFKVLAIDLLFKAYSKIKLAGRSDAQLVAKDLSIYKSCGIVFCTASPVLTNEVRRFYYDLEKKIKQFLIKREKTRLAKEQKEENKADPDQQTEVDEDVDLEFDDEDTKEAKAIKDSLKVALEAIKMDLEDQLEEETQKNIPNTIYQLNSDNFPCFLTIKKLIYMIDGASSYPFFTRSYDGKIYGMDSSTEWHNENKQGAFMINQYHKDNYDFTKKIKTLGRRIIQAEDIDDDEKVKRLKEDGIDANRDDVITVEDEGNEDKAQSDSDSDDDKNYDNTNIYENYQYLNSQKNFRKGAFKIQDQAFAQEVDFEMFESKFWGKNKGRLKISAMNVWTEIISVIKGGLQTDWYSYIRRGNSSIMSKKRYFKVKSSMPYLSEPERARIYWLYVKYEQWKNMHNYYDFMDVVKHVFFHTPIYSKTKIDYLVVDEVQDLTPLTIQLLVSVTNQNVFFCGDTAQTIAKGVGFRFHDLKDIFSNKQVDIPTVVQLTKNYRSHNKILDLANSIVDVIELFFPETIDKLQREKSDLDGPKPILLEGYKGDDLMAMIIGHTETRSPQFGCNQVVIVRDQETKRSLPVFLKQALCLTVYEAKGLEFDDVILYNFFTDSHAGNQWRLLGDVEVHTSTRRKLVFDEDFTLNELDYFEYKKKLAKLEEEQKIIEGEIIPEDEIEEYSYLEATRERDDVLRNFSLLCNDLKHLYVSITRPKERLLIYDETEEHRSDLKRYWISRGVVDVVKKGEEKDHPVLRHGFETLANEASSKQEWFIMGVKLFRKKFYESAATCFEQSGDLDLKDKCFAYSHADNATKLLNEAEVLFYAASNNKNLKKPEKKAKRNEGKKIKHESSLEYLKAAEIFEKLENHRQAAQCYYTAENHMKAAELFEKCGKFALAAECYKTTKQFSKAAKMFEESGLILKALECYEYLLDWESILLCLSRNKDQFKAAERESLTNKYIPIALNSIFSMLQENNDEENRGKQLADKYKQKVNEIKEEISEGESDSGKSEKDQDKAKDKDENQNQEDKVAIDENEDEGEDEFDLDQIAEEQVLSMARIASTEKSFDVISKAELQENFEHLSNFDPEDEFLSSKKSFSVIGSVISNDKESISGYSDFSIVSGSRAGSIINSNVIETNRDIYIEDVVIQKIIYYISLFSEDTKNYLHKFRSKSQLRQESKSDLKVDAFELELDNIDTDLVKILLDVLESYDMYRLCMIVCNRYGISDQLSRYLTSVCFKYSNLKLLDNKTVLKINDPVFREKQAQVSVLANEAVHNMFSLMSPDLIKQVKTEEQSEHNTTANIDCWRFLFYLGFWKKLVYIIDSLSSLKLCYTTGDFKNFKIVYLLNYRPNLSDEEVKEL